MITIRLLGGAKRALGKPSVDLDRPAASVAEILQFLTSIANDAHLLQPNNLIIAVNGIDSAALQGQQTLAKSGDAVTIVTVVHGGAIHVLDGLHISITGIRSIVDDPGDLIDRLRVGHHAVSIQAIAADAVYGVGHILEILRMALEAEKRKMTIANRLETELLLRLACTGQISDAIYRAGLKKDRAGCFVAFSQKNEALLRFVDNIRNEFEVDDSVLEPTVKKKTQLASLLGAPAELDDSEFLQYLVERAAILLK